MRGKIFMILSILLGIVLAVTVILQFSKSDAASKEIWNNGIHDGCGGRWHIVARHYDYVYECDTCYASFISSDNYCQIK